MYVIIIATSKESNNIILQIQKHPALVDEVKLIADVLAWSQKYMRDIKVGRINVNSR